MKICICGGGGLGHVCAGVFASQGHLVNILSGHPQQWSKKIFVKDSDGKYYSGLLNIVSNSPERIVPDAEIVLLCVPGYLIEDTLLKIKPYLNYSVKVGAIVSSTGFFFQAHRVLGNKYCLFGFQRVPYISRVSEYGKSANLLGYKQTLNTAIENCESSQDFASELSKLFMTPVNVLNSFYEASLTNSNPILHTGRLYTMWGTHEVLPTKEQSYFYADWTDEASQCLIDMDNEFMKLLSVLNVKDGVIPSLLVYYESTNAKTLTAKIRSIKAFKTIKSPMIQTEKGWMPDYGSRYFTEDFPFGLKFIKDLMEKHSIPSPTIDKVYNWGLSINDSPIARFAGERVKT